MLIQHNIMENQLKLTLIILLDFTSLYKLIGSRKITYYVIGTVTAINLADSFPSIVNVLYTTY